MKINKSFLPLVAAVGFIIFTDTVTAQITERARPAEWNQLVNGGRFKDRFLAMPPGKLSSDVWGAENVIPRYVDNGIEDSENSYWGGNILLGKDGKYNLFVCGWPDNSDKGHHQWPWSTVYHAVSDKSTGPYKIIETIGKGHNPEAFRLKDGRYVLYVINGYYIANSINGPWEARKFDFDTRDRKIIEGLSNLTFTQREDGSMLMICRGGGVWISKDGLTPYNQITDKRVYPPVVGEFEDPVIWKDNVQYHLIVNDWLGRIALYQRSKDGVNWVHDPGEAYVPGVSFHGNGYIENWHKYERIKILQDQYGRAIQANFAVIDAPKDDDKANDNHSSKNICIPLNKGLLLSILNKKAVTEKTKQIKVKIEAEPGFDPQRDVDINSLRFGASTEVNFGKGGKALSSQKTGSDLVVTFDGSTSGITGEEFAPKLIGKNTEGKMIYGYARMPELEYIQSILSARKPVFSLSDNSTNIVIKVENFGLVTAKGGSIKLEYKENDKLTTVGSSQVPAIAPYQGVDVAIKYKKVFEKGRTYDFIATIVDKNKNISTYNFTTTPL